MVVALVALLAWGVDVDVHRDAVALGQLAGVAAGQVLALVCVQLGRQGHDELAGHSGVAALVVGLDGVPQIGAGHGAAAWQDDFAGDDTALAGVVVDFARALVHDALGGAVRCSSRRAAASGAAHGLCAEVVHGHARILAPPQVARREAARIPAGNTLSAPFCIFRCRSKMEWRVRITPRTA